MGTKQKERESKLTSRTAQILQIPVNDTNVFSCTFYLYKTSFSIRVSIFVPFLPRRQVDSYGSITNSRAYIST